MSKEREWSGQGDTYGVDAPLDGLKILELAETSLINQLLAAPHDRSCGREDLILHG